ncbi:MAG: hypothetical protein PVG69_06010 [Desulfobacterales bacterium]
MKDIVKHKIIDVPFLANSELVTETVFFDTDSSEGIAATAASGGRGY